MRRAALAALALALALVGAEQAALATARARGLSWERLERGLLHRRLVGPRLGGRRAEAATWSLRRPGVVVVEGLALDLDGPAAGPAGPGGAPLPALPGGLTVELVDVHLDLPGLPPQRLSGALDAEGLRLEGEGLRAQAPGPDGARALAEGRLQPEVEGLTGALRWTATLKNEHVHFLVEGEDLTLRHPALGARALALGEVTAEGRVAREGLGGEGALRWGGLALTWSLACAGPCELVLRGEDLALAEAAAALGAWLPEARGASLSGQLSFALAVDLDAPRRPRLLTLEGRGLAVEGALPRVEALRRGPFTHRVMSGAEGEPALRTSGEGQPGWTPLSMAGPWIVAAVIAAEDAAFLQHPGVDLGAIAEAFAANVEAGAVVRGGSTLTQQLAKNLYLDGRRTLHRKLAEALFALELDRALGKERVLELYLNVVEWGPGIHGIAAAAERYFLKRPAGLQPHEAAFLASILPDPRGGYARGYLGQRPNTARVAAILDNMAEGGALGREEARAWAARPLRFVPPPKDDPTRGALPPGGR